jgi:hypothetical protein
VVEEEIGVGTEAGTGIEAGAGTGIETGVGTGAEVRVIEESVEAGEEVGTC